MALQEVPAERFSLLCRVRTRLCALPLRHVVETMRPLPVEALPKAHAFVRGLAVVRGIPIPVVDAGALLGDEAAPESARFVSLKTGERHIALAVEGVLGIHDLTSSSPRELPPLLREANADVVSALSTLDSALLLVLQDARMVPESVWQSLETVSP